MEFYRDVFGNVGLYPPRRRRLSEIPPETAPIRDTGAWICPALRRHTVRPGKCRRERISEYDYEGKELSVYLYALFNHRPGNADGSLQRGEKRCGCASGDAWDTG